MALSDAERFPLLNEEGLKMLDRLRGHPCAPRFNHPCGDMLTQAGFEAVHTYETNLADAPRGWAEGSVPPWVSEFVEHCRREVPFYRRHFADSGTDFFRLPCCDRRDLKRKPEAFVTDGSRLDEMIVYWTTGTTGQALDIYSHPIISSMYLAALRHMLGQAGITLDGGAGRVSIANVSDQNTTFTYATIMTYLRQAGHVKVNLNTGDWNRQEDRAAFLDDCDPEIYTGDPIAFAALARLPLRTRPKALVSSAMTLLPAWKNALEERFECPVLDVYSMNESRFIAVASADVKDASTVPVHEIVPHDVFVEIIDAAGDPVPSGARGEIAVTCGRNPYLPLIRYRTGDFASMRFSPVEAEGVASETVQSTGFKTVAVKTKVEIVGLEGRAATLFFATDGRVINSINVTHSLGNFAFAQFALRQTADGSLSFKARGGEYDAEAVRKAILDQFGTSQMLTIGDLTDAETTGGKIISYECEISDRPFQLKL
ncbi:MAG: hypothetical protein HQM09_07640 [Candidatus Riflebacteria bacterium]|nr:hypothetical protein [Candidatus Riflebacteria bacterium]